MGQQIYLKDVRLSFPDLFEAKTFKDGSGKPRYGASFMVDPDSPNHETIEAAILAAAKEAWGEKSSGKLKQYRNQKGSDCYRDGDNLGYDEYEGLNVLSAYRQEKDGAPDVVHNRKEDGKWIRLEEKDGIIYAGCRVNAVVEIWIQTKDYPGIRCTLRTVQFYKDDEAFSGGGRPDADDELEELDVDEADDLI